MLPLEASPYLTIAASIWHALSSLDYDHLQLQLLPQLGKRQLHQHAVQTVAMRLTSVM